MMFGQKDEILKRIIMNQNVIMLALSDIATDPKTKEALKDFANENKKFLAYL